VRKPALLAALALLAAGAARPNSLPRSTGGLWYRYPLPGAEVKSLVADPSASSAFWLGTAQGGLYRSTDGGRSWAPPSGEVRFPGFAVTALVPDPFRAETLWVGLTGVVKGGKILRSDDGGRTFDEVRVWDARAGARVLAVGTVSGRRVVVCGGDGGLELSEDGGATWRGSHPPLNPGSGISFVAFHPLRPQVLFSGSFRHPFRSVDLGRTWTRIAGGMVEDTEVFAIDFSPADPDDFWAATCGWVYRTTNGGATWTRYREGLADRRTHVVRIDPRDPSRILAGTTGGLFESRDAGKSFRRLGPEVVINELVFDPRRPERLVMGTEADGVFVSEDGGITWTAGGRGLAEARLTSVAAFPGGRVVVSRAADGASGGLWSVDTATGEAERLSASPSSTVLGLSTDGERLLAATPDGVFLAVRPGAPFAKVLGLPARGFARSDARIAAATDGGVYESRDAGTTWSRMGALAARIEAVRRARVPSLDLLTWAADVAGGTVFWDGREWTDRGPATAVRPLSGGFGRPRVAPRASLPLGVELNADGSLLVFRPADDGGEPVALSMPEAGLVVAGWAGDPREPTGLFLATVGRGLFRFVPAGS
jgi:photosystem II stability/assembly factor-like uncharacterized protein